METFIPLFSILVLALTTVVCYSLYKLFIEPAANKKLLQNEIDQKESLIKMYCKDEKTKSYLFLEAYKEIEIARYEALAQAYSEAEITVSDQADPIGQSFAPANDAALTTFIKAVELVSGMTADELADKVAQKMKDK